MARVDAGCLVLGSLPGRRSLEAGEYYAHPRNAFWRIMGEVAGAGPELPYPGRLERLVEARIALWDVLASSERPGSLDAAIRRDSAVPNDFAAFLGAHARIQCICFNGQAAASLFSRLVANEAGVPLSGIRLVTLPSTSPAHAALPFEAKLGHWADALRPVIRNHSSSPGAGHQ
ncbi:MAG: DNA-deoxyinosine glycosylase [Gammaproteobacteria bacterium]|nr:DNA-deoxyinosine glycosylase [Gammaproteobacteria bacterium]